MTGTAKATLYCSFCGRAQYEVRRLIAGPTVFICNECVELGMSICQEESRREAAERSNPKPGETWRHCKGTLYQILDLTPDRGTEDNELIVRYRAHNTSEEPHARRMSNFMERHSSGAWRYEPTGYRLPEAMTRLMPCGEILASHGEGA